MGALTAPQQIGVREDISDLLYMSDAKETPATTMMKKGPAPLDPLLWEYGLKNRGTRKRGGVPDGQDVNAFDSQNPRVNVQARSEVWRRNPMVGFIAQIRSLNGAVAGVKNQYTEAVADQLVELKRDIETEILSNQDSIPDDGVNGAQTRGMGRWIYEGTATLTIAVGDSSPTTGYFELPVPAGYRTPSAQIYTGSLATFVETDLNAMIQGKWDNTGASSELIGFVTSAVKNRIGTFAWYQKDVSGYTASIQLTNQRMDGNTLLGPIVDIYKSDWGTYRFYPVANDFMPTAYTGYFVDMKQVQLRVTENSVEMDLPNLGGGKREMIQSFMGLEMGDPRAHAKIDASA